MFALFDTVTKNVPSSHRFQQQQADSSQLEPLLPNSTRGVSTRLFLPGNSVALLSSLLAHRQQTQELVGVDMVNRRHDVSHWVERNY